MDFVSNERQKIFAATSRGSAPHRGHPPQVFVPIFRERPICAHSFAALAVAGVPILDENRLNKSRIYKYIRRWRGPDGKFRYAYSHAQPPRPRRLRVGDSVDLVAGSPRGRFKVRALPSPETSAGTVQLQHPATSHVFHIPKAELETLYARRLRGALRPKHRQDPARAARTKADRDRLRREQKAVREAADAFKDVDSLLRLPAEAGEALRSLQAGWDTAMVALYKQPSAARIRDARKAGLAFIEAAPTPILRTLHHHNDATLLHFSAALHNDLSTSFPGWMPDDLWARRVELCLAPEDFLRLAAFRDIAAESIKRDLPDPFKVQLKGNKTAHSKRSSVTSQTYQMLEPTPELLRKPAAAGRPKSASPDLYNRLLLTAGPTMRENPYLSKWRPHKDFARYALPLHGHKVFVTLGEYEALRINKAAVNRLKTQHDRGHAALTRAITDTYKRITGSRGNPSIEEMASGIRGLARKLKEDIERGDHSPYYDTLSKMSVDEMLQLGPRAALSRTRYELLRNELKLHLNIAIPRSGLFLSASPSRQTQLLLDINSRIGKTSTEANRNPRDTNSIFFRRIRSLMFHLYGYPNQTRRALLHEALCRRLHTGPHNNARIRDLKKMIPGANLPFLRHTWATGGSMALVARLMKPQTFTPARVWWTREERGFCTLQNDIHLPKNEDGVKMLVHEYGHAIEHAHPGVSMASKALVVSRAQDEFLRSLRSIASLNYADYELTYEDNWRNPYTGRFYLGTPSTEVISMGLERLVANCVGFMLDDPIHALHVLATLFGEYGDQIPMRTHKERNK